MKLFHSGLSAVSVIMLVLLLGSCSSTVTPNYVHSADDLEGKTVGVISGTVSESYIAEYPGSLTVRKFASTETASQELLSGEVDAVIADSQYESEILNKSSKLTVLEDHYVCDDYCIAVSQENTVLYENINNTLDSLEKHGTMDELIDGWLYNSYEYISSGEIYSSSLTIAVCPDFWPYAFYNDENELCGLEIDLMRLICDELEVGAEFLTVSSDRLVYMVESGKVSLAIGRIVRADSAVLYSDPYLSAVQDILVRKD